MPHRHSCTLRRALAPLPRDGVPDNRAPWHRSYVPHWERGDFLDEETQRHYILAGPTPVLPRYRGTASGTSPYLAAVAKAAWRKSMVPNGGAPGKNRYSTAAYIKSACPRVRSAFLRTTSERELFRTHAEVTGYVLGGWIAGTRT